MKHVIRKYSKLAIIVALLLVLITVLVNHYQYEEDKKAIASHQIAAQQLPTDDLADELAEGS